MKNLLLALALTLSMCSWAHKDKPGEEDIDSCAIVPCFPNNRLQAKGKAPAPKAAKPAVKAPVVNPIKKAAPSTMLKNLKASPKK